MSGGARTERINEKRRIFRQRMLRCRFYTACTVPLPLRGSVAPAEGLRAAGRDISTVGAKCFRCAEGFLQPKTYEPPDGDISTVGAKCFRCAEVLLQPKTYEPPGGTSALWARNASVARKCCSSRRPTSRRAGHQYCGREVLPLRGSCFSQRRSAVCARRDAE